MPRIRGGPRDVITDKQFMDVLKQEPDADMRALMILLYRYGCRISEGLNLTKDDIRLDERYLMP